MIRWIFAQRLAGHSVALIARALNEARVPCPSAADPHRNPHRPGTGWILGTVTTILQNPRYTGPQVWNRRTDRDLANRADVSLGQKQAQRCKLPDGSGEISAAMGGLGFELVIRLAAPNGAFCILPDAAGPLPYQSRISRMRALRSTPLFPPRRLNKGPGKTHQ